MKRGTLYLNIVIVDNIDCFFDVKGSWGKWNRYVLESPWVAKYWSKI